MPSGVYKRKPQPKKVRQKISRTLKSRKVSCRTGKPTYPWNRWFMKGRIRFFARQGEEFTCSVPSFVQAMRNEASNRGVSVKAVVEGKWVFVQILK